MNVFELMIFLLICAAFGFLGHLVSPRYGWMAGIGLAVLLLILLLGGGVKRMRDFVINPKIEANRQTEKAARVLRV